MLKRLFTAPVNPEGGIAFLEQFLRKQAWVLVGKGSRKNYVQTFVPQAHMHAKPFIAEQMRHERDILVLMGTPNRILSTEPLKDDLRATQHIGIEVTDAGKAELDAFEHPPAVWLKGSGTWIAIWRLLAPIHPDIADTAEKVLVQHFAAKHLGARRLNHLMPLPNIGGFRLVEFAKDRFVVPTDFRSASQAQATETRRASFSTAANVEAEEIPWLWRNVVAKGALTLVAGEPGMGKSQIAVYVAAVLSAGGYWPDGSRSPAGSAIICETEDDPASVIRPRLEAAGADLGKIAFGPHLDLTVDFDALIEQADTMPDLGLLVLSPVISFFGPTINDDNTVRQRLKPLLEWAAAKQVAIVGLAHPKEKRADAFAGSDAYRKVARAAWSAVVDPNDPEPEIKRKQRLLIGAKANNAPDTLRLAYRIQGVTLKSGIETSRINWLNESEAQNVIDIPRKPRAKSAARPSPEKRDTPTTLKAADWLADALKGGPRTATDLKAEATDLRISTRALYAAKESLGVVIEDAFLITEPKTWRLP
jgi:putative DNA primase/helicase